LPSADVHALMHYLQTEDLLDSRDGPAPKGGLARFTLPLQAWMRRAAG